MLNKVMLIGHLGGRPELRTLTDNSKVVNFSLATSEVWRDKATGERRERTEWHRVVIFDQTIAEIADKYLRRGSRVYIEGSIQSRKWTDKAGVERTVTEVVIQQYRGKLLMLESKPSSISDDREAEYRRDAREHPRDDHRRSPARSTHEPPAFPDDEIPF